MYQVVQAFMTIDTNCDCETCPGYFEACDPETKVCVLVNCTHQCHRPERQR